MFYSKLYNGLGPACLQCTGCGGMAGAIPQWHNRAWPAVRQVHSRPVSTLYVQGGVRGAVDAAYVPAL